MIEAWFDGVCEPRNPGGHAAWGAVVMIDGIEWIRESGYCGVGSGMSNNVAEYSGAIRCLETITGLPGKAILRGDSKLVIMQLTRQWKVNGGLYLPFYERAMSLWAPLKKAKRITAELVPRDENGICDVLSKGVLHRMGVQFRIQPEAQQ